MRTLHVVVTATLQLHRTCGCQDVMYGAQASRVGIEGQLQGAQITVECCQVAGSWQGMAVDCVWGWLQTDSYAAAPSQPLVLWAQQAQISAPKQALVIETVEDVASLGTRLMAADLFKVCSSPPGPTRPRTAARAAACCRRTAAGGTSPATCPSADHGWPAAPA